MGIISVEDYYTKLNWTTALDENGLSGLVQTNAPDLSSFDAAITGCSMNEIDIVEYCVEQGYVQNRIPLVQQMEKSATRLMASVAVKKTPAEKRKEKLAIIAADPKAFFAHVVGIPLDHAYFDMVDNPNIQPVNHAVTFQQARAGNLLPLNQPQVMVSGPQVASQSMTPYTWNGSMSELWKPAETSLDFPNHMSNDYMTPTNIGNPTTLDGSLLDLGYGYNFLQPECKFKKHI
jgi:hypothetical protein